MGILVSTLTPVPSMPHPAIAGFAIVSGAIGATLGLVELWLSRTQKSQLSNLAMSAYVWLDDRKDPVRFCHSIRVPVTILCVIVGVGDALNANLLRTSWRTFGGVSFIIAITLFFLGSFSLVYPRLIRAITTAGSSKQFFLRLTAILIVAVVLGESCISWFFRAMSWQLPPGDAFTTAALFLTALLLGTMETVIVVLYSVAFMIGLLALFYVARFVTLMVKVMLCRIVEDNRGPVMWLSTLLVSMGLIAKAIG
ncbi:MAG TPA: hypothetical protein VFJ82_09480 [Longimicrobium sp.]|nr:hypothetical protein [Longimicrobium sp.]